MVITPTTGKNKSVIAKNDREAAPKETNLKAMGFVV